MVEEVPNGKSRKSPAAVLAVVAVVCLVLFGVAYVLSVLVVRPPSQDELEEPDSVQAQHGSIDFSARTLDGRTLSLGERRGKVTVVDFWATWCGPCIQSLPLTAEVVDEFKGQDVQLWAITDEDPAHVRQFMSSRGLQLNNVLFDPDQQISKRYNVRAIPATFLINQKGEISHNSVGFDPDEVKRLRGVINRLLNASSTRREAGP